MAKLLVPAAVFALGAGSVTAVKGNADPPPATVTVTTTTEKLVENHGVEWWARRAKSNGGTMRKRAVTIRVLRHSLHAGIRLGASGLERAFLCIHRFEGSWTDRGAPYFGGLQMDGSFMAAYGGPFLSRFGHAGQWTPAMQLATAERAYLSGRGFGPWPNTSRRCGLR